MKSLTCMLPFLSIVCLVSTGRADWNVGDPAKWVQLPDETPAGFDVKLHNPQDPTPFVWLADDFLCTEKGPITDVHIWASWLNDTVPPPEALGFNISIWTDIPATTNEHSRPGNLLWDTNILYPDYVVRHWTTVDPGEGWYNPIEGLYDFPTDTNIWQYNFFFDEEGAFIQEGSVDEPIVYWLGIRAIITEPGPFAFGWKSSETNWNDDAVYAEYEGSLPLPGDWGELVYPDVDHPRAGESMDLSFVITSTNEPVEPVFDWGDAPTNYPTLAVNTGANHMIVGGAPWFGDFPGGLDLDFPDAETDGQPTLAADGDDIGVGDDEDGILFSPPIPGQAMRIDMKTPIGGQVDAWIDLNADGDWADIGEYVFSGTVPPGTNSIYPVIPFSLSGPTYARFRIGSSPGGTAIPVDGPWPDGEVEDHLLVVPEYAADFGDAPSPGFPTVLVDTGAYHMIIPGVMLGAAIDGEIDGQPNGTSTGDDLAPGWLPDDEDGIILPPRLIIGAVQTFRAIATLPGHLSVWIDFDADGTWTNPADFAGVYPLAPGTNLLPIATPPTAVAGGVHSRFRYSVSVPILSESGFWGDGEVEDYEIEITAADFGDAPDPTYPTTLAATGAWHAVPASPVVYLGATVDTEPDGQPSAAADGDDVSGGDEDGVTVTSVLLRGSTGVVTVVASTNANLFAWIDMNQNGSWADVADKVISGLAVTSGINHVQIPVPTPATVGSTFARFRISTSGAVGYLGFAPDGEVEDYVVEILQPAVASTNLVITNITVSAGTTGEVYWTWESNVTYQLQATTNTTAPYWTNWGDVGAPVTAPMNYQYDTDVTPTNKIYRVTVPWTP